MEEDESVQSAVTWESVSDDDEDATVSLPDIQMKAGPSSSFPDANSASVTVFLVSSSVDA
jgi:hypothetical protein